MLYVMLSLILTLSTQIISPQPPLCNKTKRKKGTERLVTYGNGRNAALLQTVQCTPCLKSENFMDEQQDFEGFVIWVTCPAGTRGDWLPSAEAYQPSE